MYIFQPDRFLLSKQIKKHSSVIRGRVLDVGAGTVDRYGDLFDAKEYIRMDIAAREGIDVVGTAYAIPFPDDSFDALVLTQVFEHLAYPVDAAKELYRVLRTGGHMLVTAPQTNELHEEPYDFFRYTSYGIHALFEKAGFTVVSLDQRGGFYSLIAQLHIRHAIDRYHLYDRPIIGRFASKLAYWYGTWMISRDARDTSYASLKHTIGWCAVLKK